MAYHGSPQDLFASEDSTSSDATVDLSVSPSTERRRVVDKHTESSGKPLSRGRRSRHLISSSDSEDDSDRCRSPNMIKCPLRHRSRDSVRADHGETVGTSSADDDLVTDVKHVTCSQQPDDRPLCKYGEKCYRRNPNHFQEFRHPGSVQCFSCGSKYLTI